MESLRGKSPFQYALFIAPDLLRKLFDSGLQEIPHDEVVLKPYLPFITNISYLTGISRQKHQPSRKKKEPEADASDSFM